MAETSGLEPVGRLWDQDGYVDEGDMTVVERGLLVSLVRHMFVTERDSAWAAMASCDMGKVRRGLSNLGLSLVVDERLGVAWAAQVPNEIRGDIPVLRRKARAERGEVAHAALCLRRHWDVCESRGESDPHVTDDELRAFVESGPLGTKFANDGEALERGVRSVCERLHAIGLIRSDSEAGTWRLMPTILVLVNDEFCLSVIGSADGETSDGEE